MKQLISSTGLGAPRKVGRPNTPMVAHEPELVAAGKLFYAQEKLSVPGAKHVVVIGDGATGAWACEASVRDDAEKVIWVGGWPKPDPELTPAIRTDLKNIGLNDVQIETYWRSYNSRNANTFKHILSGKIELRSGFRDASLDPSGKRVTATFGESETLETDAIIVAVGQEGVMMSGMEEIQFRMVRVATEDDPSRLVALEAIDPRDGRILGIRIEGSQMASPGMRERLVKNERDEFAELIWKQANAASVPKDSRGVPGSTYQTNLDVPLAEQTRQGK